MSFLGYRQKLTLKKKISAEVSFWGPRPSAWGPWLALGSELEHCVLFFRAEKEHMGTEAGKLVKVRMLKMKSQIFQRLMMA